MIKLLIQSGADIHNRDDPEGTPLHDLCRKGPLEIATLLIHKGANPNEGYCWTNTIAGDKSGWQVGDNEVTA